MKGNCPDCRRGYESDVVNGKIKCRKCYQYICIENGHPICCIPKEIFENTPLRKNTKY